MLESKDFKLSRSKTEFIKCKFSKRKQRSKELVKIATERVKQRD